MTFPKLESKTRRQNILIITDEWIWSGGYENYIFEERFLEHHVHKLIIRVRRRPFPRPIFEALPDLVLRILINARRENEII